jgi:hypothetical protein
MLLVAGIDAFGAVAGEKIDVEAQSRFALDDRHADFFGGAGIDSGFEDRDAAAADRAADRAAGRFQRPRSGRLASSMGVGTVTMKTLREARSAVSAEKWSCVVAANSSSLTSNV